MAKICFLDIPPAGKPITEMSEVELRAYEFLLDLAEEMRGPVVARRRNDRNISVHPNWVTYRNSQPTQ